MARNGRRQRVKLRFKPREQLKHNLRSVIVRSVTIALVIGFGAGMVMGGDTFLSRFLGKHTPDVVIDSPLALAGLPAMNTVPKNRLWLWIPGSGYWLEKQIGRKFNAVRAVRLSREIDANRIVVHLDPRVPLVTWNGAGFDQNGVLFAITPGTWNVLPQVSFLSSAKKPELGRWLARVSAMPELWSQVSSIKQDPSETLELTLKTNTVVIWGPPETATAARKAQTLTRVLDDAHNNLGGTARADLRFFDQGRIIVRPKSAH